MDMSSRLIASVSLISALIAHQVLRRHESYSFLIHTSLIIGPPLAQTAYFTSRAMTRFPLHTVLLALATYLLALASSVVLYRLSPLHPLACYPGPLICKVSKLWMAFVCVPGKQHKYIKDLHDLYGDVVRIGPNELSIRDASAIGPILGASGIPKGPQFLGRLMSHKSLSMIALQDPEMHLQRRRVWSKGFTPSAVKDYEELIATRVKQLVSQLDRQQRQEARLDTWLNYLSFDLMSDMAFGGGSELLSGKETKHFWSVLEDAMCLATFFGHVPWLGSHVGRIPFAAAPLKTLLTSAQELTRQRIERGTVQPDLFYYLSGEDVADEDPETRPSMQQLVDDGILAVVAGADTVASASTSLFCCLLTYPEVYEKLQAEIDKFYPPGEDPLDTKHYRDMPYLNAVINETLRLLPPVPGCTQREQPHDGPGFTAGSIYIPPGTSVWVHAYSIHRDPRNFSPAPGTFWPERWLLASASGEHDTRAAAGASAISEFKSKFKEGPGRFVHNNAAFIPFSYGPMNCVGKSLALQELRMVVCALMHRFRIRPGKGCTVSAYEEEVKDYFLATQGKVPVLLEGRMQ